MIKRLSILGSTGSVGDQVLEVIDQNPDKYKIDVLSCYGRNLEKFKEQIEKYEPEMVHVYNEGASKELKTMLRKNHIGIEVLSGEEGLIEAAIYPSADGVITSLTGSIGIKPTYEAIKNNKTIYLANKESLVVAGEIITKESDKRGVDIIPLDDEPAGIYQILGGRSKEYTSNVEKILLSCSGGPFRGKTKKELKDVTVEEALNHPKFRMGPKISMESALLLNKAHEVISIYYLFELDSPEKIETFVHPEAIIHAGVRYIDGTEQYSAWLPSTKYAIAWALSPERFENDFERVDLFKEKKLTFEKPDLEIFPCLQYGYESLKIGGSMPAAFYYAGDIATDLFLDGKVKFLGIPKIIKKILDNYKPIEKPTLDYLLNLENKIKDIYKKL
ncbi:MAG: 1-deoxy-D-xylulose-5-phosphate reductoisomerase [Candidatus Aenigmatarchaeota archaeon]